MILIIIAALVWLGLIVVAVTDAYDWSDRIIMGLMAIVLGGIAILISWYGVTLFLGSVLPHQNIYETKPILALNDSSQVSGQFFLGMGAIDSKPTYTFYLAKGHAAVLENADASRIDVYQDSAKPYVKIATDCKSSWNWLAQCNYGSTSTGDGKYDVTEIHIPKGTIKNNFVLDAK